MIKKIFTRDTIKSRILNLKKNKKKIVLCHGVFDLIHQGHLEHFKSAKKYGDYLVVSVTDDRYVNKGPNKPLFNQNIRLDFLSNITMIDAVILSSEPSSSDIINLIKPDYYVKGPDYLKVRNDRTKKIIIEKNLVKKYGGKLVYTKDQTYSSTSIINTLGIINNDSQRKFVNSLKSKFGADYILRKISEFKNLSTLVFGELIFDEYVFGEVIGKSGKEPHLVFNEKFKETYVGGSGAVARHISSFVKKVFLLTSFANEKNLDKLFKKNLFKNIVFKNHIPDKNFKSIIKTRFVDEVSRYKMFGAYKLPIISNAKNDIKLIKILNNLQKFANIQIITDYGHNLISKRVSSKILKNKKFTSISCQINSSSSGYHNIANYVGANLVIINENELRFELKNQKDKIETLIKILSKKLKFKNLILTRGSQGSIFYNGMNFTYCPAFAKKIVDKVGAGDAMLSITSLAVYKKLDPMITLFLGSLASAIAVENAGNKINVNLDYLNRNVEYILK